MPQSRIAREVLDPTRKALFINLDDSIFGSFAEIGAGQEVARCFFRSGGASGTVARTISAYDMQFSNSVYGKCPSGRYVSEQRLHQMLDIEFKSIKELLAEKRGENTRFFAFANTITTLSFKKDNDPHGWLGVRFQLNPGDAASDVVIHVRLLENDSLLQQQTIGILGVNLIYACYYNYHYPNLFISSLLESISDNRVEIDMISMSGPAFENVDNRLLAVQLVKNGMTSATMFDRNGKVQQPADLLYKKDVMVLRGSFRPITYVGFDMLKSGFSTFKKEVGFDKNKTLVLCEITLNNLMGGGDFDERDFLDRVDILCGMGQNVLISNFREFYKLAEWFRRFRLGSIRMIMGAHTFQNVLSPKYYSHLRGGMLEAFGRMFIENLKLYIYPSCENENEEVLTVENIKVAPELMHLYQHLKVNNLILGITDFRKEVLPYFSHIVLKKIKENDASWEKMTPKFVSAYIKEKNLFGFGVSKKRGKPVRQ